MKKPTFIVCEDGTEYLDRFQRFLGDAFTLIPARDFAAARDAAPGARGLLLDLDFRRTPPERLVDERGPAPRPLDAGTRARLSERTSRRLATLTPAMTRRTAAPASSISRTGRISPEITSVSGASAAPWPRFDSG